MQNHQKRNQANYSSLFQKIKSLFQGKPATPVYTHPTYLNRDKCITIDVNDLSPEAKKAFDQLFSSVFANVQPLKN